MQDAAPVAATDRPPRARPGLLATPRRRALAACAVVALLIHFGLVGGIGGLDAGASPERSVAPVSVRTIAAPPVVETVAADSDSVVAESSSPAPIVKPAEPRRAAAVPDGKSGIERAGARSEEPVAAAPQEAAASAPPPIALGAPSATVAAIEPASAPASTGESPSLLSPGELPPPLYRTRLPPSATLYYQVRRGFLRGTGEIRWQASGETYRLTLEARTAGLTLLMQTSEGRVDANGIAPTRFLDRRARRPAQAANFRRDVDRITFSGPPVEWPLVPGSQDRLSWMIQLAGIAAAEPGLLVEGGAISMVVVGARGEASVWTLRFAGREDVETAWGTSHAVKLVREVRSISDTGAEIWLDPARDYLPAHATMRNRDGAVEYDLLLERVEPSP